MSITIILIVAISILISLILFCMFNIYNPKNKLLSILEKYNIKCNILIPGPSMGLILDAKIICDKIKNIKTSKYIIIENYNKIYSKDDLFFVNLDWTEFKKLYKNDSPNNIICKTKQSYNILKNKFPNKNVLYTGFTSIDRFKPNINIDYNKIIHICGKSPYKGTLQLVKTWIKHPEFPLLTIKVYEGIQYNIQKLLENKKVNNIELNTTFINDNELDILYNTYGIHICSSNQEGWGHYIAEAKACKAVVLYTGAPSMSETFVDGYDGISIRCDSAKKMINDNICPYYELKEDDIANSVKKLLKLTLEEKKMIGENARNSFLKNDIEFTKRLINLVSN